MNRGIKFSIAVSLLLVLLVAAYWGFEQPYTARIVDAETGEPVEGAVYLAASYSTTWLEKAWFEGPSVKMTHFREGYSDENGEIFVPGFWFKMPFVGRDRNLTVYKPGYAMWNQDYIFPSLKKRGGFGIFSRTVKQERWKPEYSYWDHYDFIQLASHSGIWEEQYSKNERLFMKIFHAYEDDLRIQ